MANKPEPRENKMGIMPINPLIVTMSLPMVMSMLVQALYNVVDSHFVSYISEDALTAVGLAFPAQNLMISVAVGTGVGINALLSKSLGEKNFDLANRTAENGVFLALCSWLTFAVLGALFSRTFIELQTDVTAIVEYGSQYLSIVTVACAGLMFQICFARLLQSTGKTVCTMLAQGTGAILNIIFDPLLIFGIGPFPRLEIAGAAWATVLGQVMGSLVAIVLNLKVNRELTLSFRGFRPSGTVIRKIYSVGIPSIIMAAIGSVMTFGVNKILGAFNSTAVAVFSAYFKLMSFIFMPVFGLNNGIVPIIAYNYGARKPDRMEQTIRLGVLYAGVIMAIGVLLFWSIPDRLLGFFNASDYMLKLGVPALRIISLSFLPAAFGIVTASVCQALGYGILAMVVSVVRQLVVILPVAWVLGHFWGLEAIWYAFPFAEIFALGLSIFFMFYVRRKVIRPLKGTDGDGYFIHA